jgi:hypothetical protein
MRTVTHAYSHERGDRLTPNVRSYSRRALVVEVEMREAQETA